MKKQVLILILLILASSISFGQKKTQLADVIWGETYKNSRRASLSGIIHSDESGFYTLSRDKGLKLQYFDNAMNKINSSELDLSQGEKEKYLEFFISTREKLLLFSGFVNQKQKKKFLFVQSVNLKSLSPNDDIKKIGEINFEGSKKRYNTGSFDYEISRDSSKYVIYYNLPYEKKGKEKIGLIVYTIDHDKLWEKEIEFPYLDSHFRVSDYELDNQGTFHVLGKIFQEKKEREKKKPFYHYEINSYFADGTEKNYKIEIENKFLKDMQISLDDDGNIICAGFYSSKGTWSIDGSYFIKIDAETKQMVSESYNEFGMDFILQNLTEKQEKKVKKKQEKGKDAELYKYDLDQIILKDDGGAVLVGEQYFVRVVTNTTSNGNGGVTTTTTYHYHYNDIIVISISPSGDILWTEKIPKRQKTTNDGGYWSSYAMAVVKDKLFFIYNDNGKNLFYKEGNKLHQFSRSKDSIVMLSSVDYEGNTTREALFTIEDSDLLTRPKISTQLSSNELVILGRSKKSHRYAKVIFKD